MRRIVLLLLVFVCALPVGVSLSGCGKRSNITYCSGSSGVRVGQITSIDLEPRYYGKSLAYGQTDTFSSPTAADCEGTAVSTTFKFASSNQAVVDIDPATGSICAGSWNRNSANGVADYSYCTPGTASGTSDIIATGGGGTSNKVTVYVHAPVATMTLGNSAVTSGTCSTDPSTDCCPITGSTVVTASPYDFNTTGCISQNTAAQIVSRAYDASGNNITCSIGHPTYNAITSGLLTLDENGVATAIQPGATVVTATVARNTSTAGIFSVCAPASIAISTPNSSNGAVTINPNVAESITSTVTDIKGATITGLSLTYTSTTPTTITATSSGITATYPSSSAVTAYCAPPTCNPAPTDYVGTPTANSYAGNGKPVVSNSILATSTGNSSTLLWAASTGSQYITPMDFFLNTVGSPVKLPVVPNSMVITQDGSTLYLGSPTELMTFSTSSNTVSKEDITAQGAVLAAAPDNSSVVLADPNRKVTGLYVPSSSAYTVNFSGVGKAAAYSPDSSTVYVLVAPDANSTPTQLVAYNSVTGLATVNLTTGTANDVAVTIPHEGAYTIGDTGALGFSYCSNSDSKPITDVNKFPVANSQFSAQGKYLTATNDGKHILALNLAAAGGTPVLNDLLVTIPTGACPATGSQTFTSVVSPVTLTGVTAQTVTDIIASGTGKLAFATYTATSAATGTGTVLPGYVPATSGAGTTSNVTLVTGATAPVAGVFATNDKTFYTGTSGDNKIHVIDLSTMTDTKQVDPTLPASSGSGYATPNLMVQKPRSTT